MPYLRPLPPGILRTCLGFVAEPMRGHHGAYSVLLWREDEAA